MAKEGVKKESKEVEEGKLVAVLSYLLVGIIWFFADEKMKKNSFAKYHAKQGVVLVIAAIVYNIALGILSSLIFMPFAFSGVWGLWWLFSLLYYVPLVFVIIGIVNALNGKEKELPLIGKGAEKFKF